MKNAHEKIHLFNCLYGDSNALYHQAALKMGLSDSVMAVMYMLHYKGDGCLLSDIYRESGISKQTINSTLRKLEAEDIIFLENDRGRNKRVFLTEKGREYVLNTGAQLYRAEMNVFSEWQEEEIDQFLKLMGKYNRLFQTQIQNIQNKNGGESNG